MKTILYEINKKEIDIPNDSQLGQLVSILTIMKVKYSLYWVRKKDENHEYIHTNIIKINIKSNEITKSNFNDGYILKQISFSFDSNQNFNYIERKLPVEEFNLLNSIPTCFPPNKNNF